MAKIVVWKKNEDSTFLILSHIFESDGIIFDISWVLYLLAFQLNEERECIKIFQMLLKL